MSKEENAWAPAHSFCMIPRKLTIWLQSTLKCFAGADVILPGIPPRGKAVIMEIKVARTYQELERRCDEALKQIEDWKYEETLRQEGYSDILKYGIAFYRKECMVKQP